MKTILKGIRNFYSPFVGSFFIIWFYAMDIMSKLKADAKIVRADTVLAFVLVVAMLVLAFMKKHGAQAAVTIMLWTNILALAGAISFSELKLAAYILPLIGMIFDILILIEYAEETINKILSVLWCIMCLAGGVLYMATWYCYDFYDYFSLELSEKHNLYIYCLVGIVVLGILFVLLFKSEEQDKASLLRKITYIVMLLSSFAVFLSQINADMNEYEGNSPDVMTQTFGWIILFMPVSIAVADFICDEGLAVLFAFIPGFAYSLYKMDIVAEKYDNELIGKITAPIMVYKAVFAAAYLLCLISMIKSVKDKR